MSGVKIISLKDCTYKNQPVPKCDNKTVLSFIGLTWLFGGGLK